MRTEGKGMPFDTDPITKAFLDLAKPLRGRETPGSQIVRELDDFNWFIHTVTPSLTVPVLSETGCTSQGSLQFPCIFP